MKNTAFITGITGQDGAYLAKFLLEKGYEVVGGRKQCSQDDISRLRILGIEDRIKFVDFDLADPYCVSDVIASNRFDEVYNLGAQSFVGSSWSSPFQVTQVNAVGVLHILDSIRRTSPETRFYQASTSEMFGLVQEPVQSERTPFYPRSPYGVSKLYAHWMTVNYRESYDLHFNSGILFNHESPLRGKEFVTRKISSHLAEIKIGRRDKLRLGNLDARRDWGYAKEYVEAMWKMLQQDKPDDYVIATGKNSTVRDFVTYAARALDFEIDWDGAGLTERGYDRATGRLLVEVVPEFFRPSEVDTLVGCAEKARRKLGWEPIVGVEELSHLMAKYDLTLQQKASKSPKLYAA